MKKFGNTANKINAVLRAINKGEKLTGRQIAERVKKMGYRVNEGNLKMFIYYNMLHKYMEKESIKGVNYYYLA
ncbi:MAG: hypothetical protein GXO65_07690 [Euryarchaeota archaeon]|nr:hypothetical protein [Euryarchaeota archaeon]